ncbi:hypothetical protein QJQ45_020390 [Haematococcus lacustris]|nr:hypothetical protein QJQ45_020390 [Haematococcus lacustris]
MLQLGKQCEAQALAVRLLSWAIRAGMQPPAAELALPSMQEAAPHGAPPDLQGMWLAFLRILHHQGHFPQTGLDREAAIQEQREVKAGLLAFARSRPDLLMALDTSDVVAVAEVPLTSASSQSERKVTNADRRLKASFAPASPAPSQDPSVTSHRPPALQDATAAELSAPHGGQARVQGSEGGGVQHASTQDLVRVVWSWVAFPPHVIEGHSLGLVHALVRLLQRLSQLAQEPPRPELLQQALRLATPTTAELQGANEGRAAVARERAEARMRRERLQLLRRSSNFLQLSPGDWLCCNCGAANFRRRSACAQCGVSAHLAEHSEITPEDIRALVDTTRTSPLGGDPRQQQQGQQEQQEDQQHQQGQQKQQGQQENQQQGQQQQQQQQGRWLAPRAGVRDGHSSWGDRMAMAAVSGAETARLGAGPIYKRSGRDAAERETGVRRGKKVAGRQAEGDSDNETGTDGVKKSTGRSSALVARPRLSGNRRKLVDASDPLGDKYFAQERH